MPIWYIVAVLGYIDMLTFYWGDFIFNIFIDAVIIYILVKSSKKDYYPTKICYKLLSNGMCEYRYIYFIW